MSWAEDNGHDLYDDDGQDEDPFYHHKPIHGKLIYSDATVIGIDDNGRRYLVKAKHVKLRRGKPYLWRNAPELDWNNDSDLKFAQCT